MSAGRQGWRPTHGQHQMLMFDRITPGSSWHNVPLSVRITGRVDTDAVTAAVERALARHPILRTAFTMDGDEPVARTTDTPITVTRRDGDPDAVRAAELRTPFDLASGRLARASLVRADDEHHELILVLHHIAVDGHSLTVLQRDLLEELRGVAAERPDFAEFAAWHHQYADSDEAAEQLDYWRDELSALPEPATLPFAGTRTSSLSADRVDFTVPAELTTAVRELAAAQRATPFMVLLTAFGVLIRRYTGSTDLVIGTPMAGRDRAEVADLVGYLVNMMPLRLRLGGATTWLDALTVARNSTLDGYENSGVPFGRLAEELGTARGVDSHPLFQLVFAAPPALAGPSTVDGAEYAFDGGTSTESLFDIEVQVYDDGATMHGYAKYRTGLFERARIADLVEDFLYLVERFTAAPRQPIAEVAVLRPQQWQQVVVDWNDTATDYPRDATVVALVDEWVRRTPDAPAVRYGQTELSYAELDARANKLANHLRGRGISDGDRVGVCLGFGVDWVVSALAVLKAGAAYVPLDPSYPAARMELMASDSGASVVLVDATTRNLITWPEVSTVDVAGPVIAGEPDTAPEARTTTQSVAYVMYTSGSTGRPKGVGVLHRNIVRLVRDTDYLDVHAGDSFAQASNLSFDAATLELWGALLNGARLVGIPKDDLLSAPALGQTIAEQRLDFMFLTTSLARQLAAEAPEIFAPLRWLCFGGEAADGRMVANLLAAPGPALVNGYGPTETTTFAVTHTWLPGRDTVTAEDVIPIGRPIANTTVYLLDDCDQPVGPGRVGEICIGGDGVAGGYLGNPELTAQKFIADPFQPGGRLYRTGDLGRYRDDGLIDCLGRKDRQVKIRGFRIEPGEVENCLHDTGKVRAVTVQVRRDEAGEAILVGYVVPDGEVSMDALREELRGRLPAHLVPSVLVGLDALPVTENGKLDVAALPEPVVGASTGHAPPTTPMQQQVFQVWQEVLALPELGVHDDFFTLGGHSIKAGQVMTRLKTALQMPAPLRLIFDNPTVATLAQALQERLDQRQNR